MESEVNIKSNSSNINQERLHQKGISKDRTKLVFDIILEINKQNNECSPDLEDESRPKCSDFEETAEEVIPSDAHKDESEIKTSSGKESYLKLLFLHTSLLLILLLSCLLFAVFILGSNTPNDDVAMFLISTDVLDQHNEGTNPHFTVSFQRALKLVSDVVVTVSTSCVITFTCWVSSVIDKVATFVSNRFHFVTQVKKRSSPQINYAQMSYPKSFSITKVVTLVVFLVQVGSVSPLPFYQINQVDSGICKISEEPRQCFEPPTATCPLRNFQPNPEIMAHLFQLLPVFKDSILPSSITEKNSLDSSATSNKNALLPPVRVSKPFQIETVPLIIMLIINPLIYSIVALMQMMLIFNGRFLRALCQRNLLGNCVMALTQMSKRMVASISIGIQHWRSRTLYPDPSEVEAARPPSVPSPPLAPLSPPAASREESDESTSPDRQNPPITESESTALSSLVDSATDNSDDSAALSSHVANHNTDEMVQTVCNGAKSRPLSLNIGQPLSKEKDVAPHSKLQENLPASRDSGCVSFSLRQSLEQPLEAGVLGVGTDSRLGVLSETESSSVGGASAQFHISPLLTPQSETPQLELPAYTIARKRGLPSRRRTFSTSYAENQIPHRSPRKRTFSTGDIDQLESPYLDDVSGDANQEVTFDTTTASAEALLSDSSEESVFQGKLAAREPPEMTKIDDKTASGSGNALPSTNQNTNRDRAASVNDAPTPVLPPPFNDEQHPNGEHLNEVIQPVTIFDDFVCSPVPQEIIFSLPGDSASETSMIPSFRNVLISPGYMGGVFFPQTFDPGVVHVNDQDMVQPVDATDDATAREMVTGT